MKVCPICQAQYDYEMSFCLQDGTPLVISGSTSETTQVLENKPPESDVTQIHADKTLAFDEKTLVLPNEEKVVADGAETLVMADQSSIPTEQMNFVRTDDIPQNTDHRQVISPTETPIFETFATPPPSSRTGLIMGAMLGGLALFATAIGGLIYLNPFGKGDEVAIGKPTNSISNQTPTVSNTSTNANFSSVFGDNNTNSVLSSNATGKSTPTTSPNQSSANKITPKPTTEKGETPASTKEPKNTPIREEIIQEIDEPIKTPPPNIPKIVSGGVVNGKAVNLVKPPYPPAARAVRASGAVAVQVTIDENGNVISASAVSGHALLRAASESAARSSKFNPTMLSGQRVKVTGVVIYNFTAQ